MTSRRRALQIFVLVTATLAVVAASCTSENANPLAPANDSGATTDQTSLADAGSSDAAEALDHTVPADSTQPDAGPIPDDGALPSDSALPDGADTSFPPDGSPPPDSGPQPDAADASSSMSALVGAAGATLQLASGAQFSIPAGALTAPLMVTLTPVAAPASGTSVGAAVRLDPLATTLLAPAQITLPLSPALVPPDAAPSSLVVARSPDGVAPFVPLASSVVNGAVTASTASFGFFAAMQQPQTGGSVFITTPSPLPRGTVGTAYTTSFAAVGGTPPYTWSVPSGSSAPPGLVLGASGALAGTPTTVGRTFFFVLVTDSLAHATQTDFELDVDPVLNPVPVLTSISPVSAPVMSSPQTIVLTGSSFLTTSVAQFDGAQLATTYSSSTQLVATIPASLLAGGPHSVTVFTPAPGGGTSAAQAFTVTAGNLAPTLSSITPTNVLAGSGDTTITVFGTNFAQGTAPGVAISVVEVNGQPVSTTYYSATVLDAILPAALLTTPGTLSITVVTPPPGGGTSAPAALFTVTAVNLAPTLTGVTPTGILVGAANTQITLSGTNFAATSVAQAGTQTLSTAYVSDTELLAIVPTALLATTGTLSITVTNPPGGGTSNAFGVQVIPPGAPTITSVSPSTIPAGSTDTTITVTGTNFDVTGRLYFNYPGLFHNQAPVHTTVTSSTTATGVLKQCMLRGQQTTTVVYAVNAADASAPPDGGASASFAVVIGPPADAGAPCDPAFCSSMGTGNICENNKCCSPQGSLVGNPQTYCCSGFSEHNVCQRDCTAAGPSNGFSVSCCGDFDLGTLNCY